MRLPGGSHLVISGMGAARARRACCKLLEGGATSLVSWGCAGGLVPGAGPGTLVIPENIIAADRSVYFVDRLWRENLIRRIAGRVPFLSGSLVESETVLTTCEDKAKLFHESEAAGVDMESASIARVAKEAGLPFLALRAVTDDAQTDLPAGPWDWVDEFGRIRMFGLLSRVAARPREIPCLWRMVSCFRAAAAALEKAAFLILEPSK